MAVRGVFASDSNLQGNRRGDFASSLLQVHPTGKAQLLALSSGMKSADAADTLITWWEEIHASGRIQVTSGGGVNSSATSLAVSDGSFITAGAILLSEATGEHVFVQAVSGNTLTIQRGFAASTAASIANSAYLQKIGSAFEEGSSRPTGVVNLGFPRFNYMQIFRNSWDITGTARRIEFHTGNQVAKSKSDCALFHSEDIERTLWFGKKSIGTLNGKPFRTMDGVRTIISSNVVTGNATPDVEDLQDFLEDVFANNVRGAPNERLAFCGNTVLGALNLLALKQGVMNLTPGVTDFGYKVTRWETPFGDISLVTHPLFNENPVWSKDLVVLHPAAMRMRYLRRTNSDDYDSNGSRAGVDGDYGVLTTEMSMEYMAEQTAGMFIGITGAGAAI